MIYSKKYERQAIEVYEALSANDVEVILFDTDDGFGSKIKNAKMLGLPKLAIIGKNFAESSKIELEDRKTGDKIFVDLPKLVEEFKSC